jgi:hypothetical protein
MKITRRQLRRIIRETMLHEKGSEISSEWSEVPENIQKSLAKNEKMGIPSEAVYDDDTGEWRVEELN